MELIKFNKTRWSFPWNSDKNYAKLCVGVQGCGGPEDVGCLGGVEAMKSRDVGGQRGVGGLGSVVVQGVGGVQL